MNWGTGREPQGEGAVEGGAKGQGESVHVSVEETVLSTFD